MFAKSKMLFENGISGRGHLAIYENLNAALPKAVMFRDSGSSWILPFLSESFSRIVALGSPHFYKEPISEKPGVVILESIERWVSPTSISPVFLPQLSFEETFKLSLDEVACKTGLVLGWVDTLAPKSEAGAMLDVRSACIPAGRHHLNVRALLRSGKECQISGLTIKTVV